MPERVTFLHKDVFKAATVTASSEVATLPVANVKDPLVDRIHRTTGDADEWIKFDLGAADYLNCIGLVGFNYSGDAVAIIEANSSDSWTSPPFSEQFDVWESVIGAGEGGAGEHGAGGLIETGLIKTPVRVHFFQSSQEYQWWRLRIQDPDNEDGYLETARVIGCQYYESARNYLRNWTHRLVDLSTKDRVGSMLLKDIRAKYNRVSFMIHNIEDDAKYYGFLQMMDIIGMTEDIIVMLEPDTGEGRYRLSFYGQFEESARFTHQALTRHKATFAFEESIGDLR